MPEQLIGPDTVTFGHEDDGEEQALAELDGRFLSTEVATGTTGRIVGMHALGAASADRQLASEGAP